MARRPEAFLDILLDRATAGACSYLREVRATSRPAPIVKKVSQIGNDGAELVLGTFCFERRGLEDEGRLLTGVLTRQPALALRLKDDTVTPFAYAEDLSMLPESYQPLVMSSLIRLAFRQEI